MKKMAVLIGEQRQREGIRMSLGLTLSGDEVWVYLLGVRLEEDEVAYGYLESIPELGGRVCTDQPENKSIFKNIEIQSPKEIKDSLLGFDHVITY
jgi:hypothetical protein